MLLSPVKMKASKGPVGAPYALGALWLGIVGFAFRDFALQWQPVPDGVPLRSEFALASAAIGAAAGLATLVPRTARYGALILGVHFGIWALLLHGPRLIEHVTVWGAWNAIAEITALTAAGFGLCATNFPGEAGRRGAIAMRAVFGACALVFAVSHFVYADFTASMIPKWLPFPLFWAYVTGIGHGLAGLSFISGIASRLAGKLLTLMYGSFVLLLHAPRVFAAPGSHLEWTMMGIALSLTGGAWIMASLSDASAKRDERGSA